MQTYAVDVCYTGTEGSFISIFLQVKNKDAIIEINDQGIGIPEKDIPYIFNRFYRSDTSRSKTDGFGLGLSTAKKIIDTHQGTICVTSIIGKGTIFHIELPHVVQS